MLHQEYDYLFKTAVFGGDYYKHHHALVKKMADKEPGFFIDLDFTVKTLPVDGKNVKLQVFDTNNSKIFSRPITENAPTYLRALDAAVIVYDMADPDLENIEIYLQQMRKYMRSMPDVIAIVGVQSQLLPRKDENIQSYTQQRGYLWQNSLNLSSTAEVEALFRNISAAIIKTLKRRVETAVEEKPAAQAKPGIFSGCSGKIM